MGQFLVVCLIIGGAIIGAAGGMMLNLKQDEAMDELREIVLELPEEALTRIIEESLNTQKFKDRGLDILTSIQILKTDMENEL